MFYVLAIVQVKEGSHRHAEAADWLVVLCPEVIRGPHRYVGVARLLIFYILLTSTAIPGYHRYAEDAGWLVVLRPS